MFSVDINLADKLWRIKEGYRLKDEWIWAYRPNVSAWSDGLFMNVAGSPSNEITSELHTRRKEFYANLNNVSPSKLKQDTNSYSDTSFIMRDKAYDKVMSYGDYYGSPLG